MLLCAPGFTVLFGNFTSMEKWFNWILVHLIMLFRQLEYCLLHCFEVSHGLHSLNRGVYVQPWLWWNPTHWFGLGWVHVWLQRVGWVCAHPSHPSLFKLFSWVFEVGFELHKDLTVAQGLVGLGGVVRMLLSHTADFMASPAIKKSKYNRSSIALIVQIQHPLDRVVICD